MPTCFILSAAVEDNEFCKFTTRYHEIDSKNFKKERMPQKHCKDNWWLIKPANLNQGRGIEISNNYTDIIHFVNS